MITEKNVANLLVVRTTAATAGMEGNNINAYTLNVGEPVVIRPGGVVVNAVGLTAANTPAIKIGTRLSSGEMNWSDIIEGRNVKSITVRSFAAATNQVDHIGYNGTSGSIEAINNNLYTMRLNILPLDKAGFMQQMIKRATYKSTAAATQAAIATGIANSLIKNLSREPDKLKFGEDRIRVERINSGTSLNTSGGAVTVSKGSTVISIVESAGAAADAGLYNADAGTIAVGDMIKFGAAAAGGTSPVYLVTAVTGAGTAAATVTLDIPYQGNSASLAANTVSVTAFADIGANWGIQLTGTAYTSNPPSFFYAIPRWTTTLEDWGTTTVTNTTRPFEGDGVLAQISEIEQQLHGSQGNFYRAQVPSPTFRSEVVTGVSYGTIVIEYVDDLTTTLGQSAVSLKQLYIGVDRVDGGSIADANTGLGTILDAFVTAHAIPCNSAGIAATLAV